MGFDIVIERVVLEQHRGALLVTQQRVAYIRSLLHQASNANRQIGLSCHADLQVGGSVSTEHLFKAAQQEGAQAFAHPFAANHSDQPVSTPVKALNLGTIEQVFEARWIASEEVLIMRSEETQGVQNFLHVGTGGFYNPILFQRRTNRDASRPGSHRE